MMSENLRQQNCDKTAYLPLISYAVDSLVRMLVQQENGKDLRTKKEIARDQDCGLNTVGSLAKLSQNGLWLKMYGDYCQQNLWGELGETSDLFCQTWPKWGMMRHGVVTELQMSARHIKGKGYLLWRTPNANDGNRGNKSPEMYDECVKTGKHAINLIDQVKNIKHWPTPTVADTFTDNLKSAQQKNGSMHSVNLSQCVNCPTPCVCMAKGASAVIIRKDGKNRRNDRLDYAVYSGKGQLNPDWVEILMGLPIGWTNIDCDTPIPWEGWPAPINMPQYGYEPSRVTTVSKNRAKRLKALGNGCVPQQVYPIFRAIMEIERKM